MDNFNLSEAIQDRDYFDCGEKVIAEFSVKEFIKKLKEVLDLDFDNYTRIALNRIIDKLAGDKLI